MTTNKGIHHTPSSKIRTSHNEEDDSLVSYTDSDSDSTSPDVYNSYSSNGSNSKRRGSYTINHDNILSNYSHHISTPRLLQNLGNCDDELNILINKTPQTPSLSKSPTVVDLTPRSKTCPESPSLSEDEDDIESELKLRINRNQEEDSVEYNDMLLEENSSAIRRAYAEAADEESSENENIDAMEESGLNCHEESDLTLSMSKTFASSTEEAAYFRKKYLETYRDLEIVSENYVKYQKSSEELEREYDAEIERYEQMVQQQDTKILLFREEIESLKQSLQESELNHSEEVDRLIEELKDSNNSEKITLDLIQDMETINAELENKIIELEEDAKIKEKKHHQRVAELEKTIEDLKHSSHETLQKVKQENEKLENDISNLRTAVETGHQQKLEMIKLTSDLDDLKRQIQDKELIIKKYEDTTERKKKAAKRLSNGFSPLIMDNSSIDTILSSFKLLSEGLLECHNLSRMVSDTV